MDKENTMRVLRTAENQALPHKKGTWQQIALDEFNLKVEQINSAEGRTGRHKKRKRKPETMFKENKLIFTSKGRLLHSSLPRFSHKGSFSPVYLSYLETKIK